MSNLHSRTPMPDRPSQRTRRHRNHSHRLRGEGKAEHPYRVESLLQSVRYHLSGEEERDNGKDGMMTLLPT